jgi:FxsC-like protein
MSPDSGLGIVLFDPWLCLDPASAEQIRRADELGADRIGTVVIWNLRDQQTQEQATRIRRALYQTAPRLLGDPNIPATLGAARVHSLEELNSQIPTVLDRALNRYLNHANAGPPPGTQTERPYLSGPGHDPPTTGPQQTGGSDG